MSDDRIYTQSELEAAVSVVRAERDEWERRAAQAEGSRDMALSSAKLRGDRLRALREGLEALVDDWERGRSTPALEWNVPVAASFAAALRALLAPSPAEGTGEADDAALDYLNRLRTMDPSPSLTRAIDEVEREVRSHAPVSSGGAGPPVIHVWGFGDASGVGASIDTGTIADVANGVLDKTESFGHEVQRSTVRTVGEGVLREAHAVVRVRPDAEPMWHRFFHPGDSWPRAAAPVATPITEDGQP